MKATGCKILPTISIQSATIFQRTTHPVSAPLNDTEGIYWPEDPTWGAFHQHHFQRVVGSSIQAVRSFASEVTGIISKSTGDTSNLNGRAEVTKDWQW